MPETTETSDKAVAQLAEVPPVRAPAAQTGSQLGAQESGEPSADTTSPPSARTGRAYFYPDVSDADWNDWRWQFKHRVTKLSELTRFLDIPNEEITLREQVLSDFRMGITPYYFALIDAADRNDPILRQVVPLADEYYYRAVGDEDPLGEEKFSPVAGITHRYPDRVLMVLSNNCAIYCRYCTRKRTMYEGATPDVEIDRMVEYIATHKEVRDVVVSGGDPLNYTTSKLEGVLSKLRAIPHLEIIRIGTRVPVALPQRIDDELCEMLARYHPLWVNVHFNHPRELTPEAARACDKLSRAGIPLNNQAVLLKGVNDDTATIKALCHGLMKMRVRPYYLYQCDPVRGAEHFRTPISKGLEIMEGLRGHTSGLAIPTYVVDAPGGGGKIPVAPQYLLDYDEKRGRAILRNYQRQVYEYVEPQPLDMLEPTPRSGALTHDVSEHAQVSSNGGNGNAHGNGSHDSGSHGDGAATKADVVGKSQWVHKGPASARGKALRGSKLGEPKPRNSK